MEKEGSGYLIDLGLGLLFCVIGGGSYVVNKIKNLKQNPTVSSNNIDNVSYSTVDENINNDTVNNDTVNNDIEE